MNDDKRTSGPGRNGHETEPEVAALRELPAAIDPERDLWPEIRRRTLASDAVSVGTSTGRRAWLAAAVGVIVVGVAFWAGRWSRPESARTASTDVPDVRVPTPAGISDALVRTAERDLRLVSGDLREALERHRAALPPATLRLVEGNLATIERAIGEIVAALEERPHDAELQRMLVAYRERELGLLRHVTRAAARL